MQLVRRSESVAARFHLRTAVRCGTWYENSLHHIFHSRVLQFVLFAIFLVSAAAFLLMLLGGIFLASMFWTDTSEDVVFEPIPWVRLFFQTSVPLSVAGVCWAWVGILNRVPRQATLKLSLGGLMSGPLGLAVMSLIGWMSLVDTIDTEADARPVIERLVRQRARSYPDTMRIIDLQRQIRNIAINGPSMDFEADWTRYIKFDFDTGCGEIVSLLVYVGEDGPAELSGRPKQSCASASG